MQPKDYTYKLPDDYTMDPELRAKLDALVADTDLSNAEAQRFVDLHVELTEDFVERLQPLLKTIGKWYRVSFWVGVVVLTAICVTISHIIL